MSIISNNDVNLESYWRKEERILTRWKTIWGLGILVKLPTTSPPSTPGEDRKQETSLEEENFQQGDIRAFFKRAGRSEITEVEPETENDYLEEPIIAPDNNGNQRMTMMRGKMEKCRKRKAVLEKRQKRLMKRKMTSKSHMGEKSIDAKDISIRNLVQDGRDLVVTGADVEGLYPSLSDIEVAIIVYGPS